ncbi:MAG TPA: tRNA epoxyqueuosine(34) reductase QueG [Methylomirabilota bacterium]|nr:tRNA epoxyqueuosine(34) reductase QueG [Methylomirabilota bacterium]
MKSRIRQRALDLGFDDCRFTSAAPPASADFLRAWLAEGRHGDMAWMARNAARRADPNLVLPGAQTIVTLAAAYGDGSSVAPSPPVAGPRGVVARYARHADYHDVLGERLRDLADFIDTLGEGVRSLWYVDTGPVLERDLAQRAGLGFVGKHTNLISRRLGNWFFLAEVLTTLKIEPDEPERNRCGRCVRCLSACPTAAITAPFQLDARRCISYLTIELKGSIPPELRHAVGTRIFGCDDCLEVCPWNRFARQGRLMQAHARRDLTAPDLLDLLALDEEGFRSRFAGTPAARLKRRGLLRNVCVALGNAGDATALPALERAARDPEPLIAEHAAWAKEQILRRPRQTPLAEHASVPPQSHPSG